jgi:serine kinase of HPr protein (carbohydrate metabolism regulator)
MMKTYQASCVAIGGRALLIEGAPGSGKSSLALALMDRGAVLIGDDGVMLEPREGRLLVHPHPNTRGLLEVRNLGLLRFAVCDMAPAALLIRLTSDAERYVEAAQTTELAGVRIPVLHLWPGSPVLHLRAELALKQFGIS